jgi:hypothetical protein
MITGVRSGTGLGNYWIGNCSGWLYCQPTKIGQMTEPTMERMVVIMEKLEAKMISKLDVFQENVDG